MSAIHLQISLYVLQISVMNLHKIYSIYLWCALVCVYIFFAGAGGCGTGFSRVFCFGGCQAHKVHVVCLMTMADDNNAVVQSLISVVRDAVRRNAAVNSDDDTDFSSVLSATRSALRRRRSRNVPGECCVCAVQRPIDGCRYFRRPLEYSQTVW